MLVLFWDNGKANLFLALQTAVKPPNSVLDYLQFRWLLHWSSSENKNGKQVCLKNSYHRDSCRGCEVPGPGGHQAVE